MFTFLITWRMLKFSNLSSPAFIRPCYGNNFSVLPPPGEELLTSVIIMIFIGMFQMLQHLLCTNLISVLVSLCSSLIEAPTPRWLYNLLFPNQTSTMDLSIDLILKRELQIACPSLPPSSSMQSEWLSPPFILEAPRTNDTPFHFLKKQLGIPIAKGGNEARIGNRSSV